MYRTLLAGVAALGLMSGAALADDYSSQTTTTTAAPVPAPVAPVDSVSKTTTKTQSDSFGNQSEERDSVHKSQALSPDGASTTVTHTHSESNNSDD